MYCSIALIILPIGSPTKGYIRYWVETPIRTVIIHLSAILCALFASAADKSNCPTALAGLVVGRGADAGAALGLGAAGIGGLPGTFGAPGFAASGGGFGLTGPGGLEPSELEGFEGGAGMLGATGVFFHGVADPFDGPMPGNTATGLSNVSGGIGLTCGLGAAGAAGRRGGGGGAAFEGTSSR